MRLRFPAAALAVLALLPLVGCSQEPAARQAQLTPVPGVPAAVASAGDPEAAAVISPAPFTDADTKVVVTPGGVVLPVLGQGDHGWKVSTPCGRDAVVSSATPLRKATVVLDPGHGGYDPGAVGPNGLSEATLNLNVSRHAKAALERAGVSVVLTRNDEHGMNLVNRAQVAVALDAKAFVSIHHNAASTVVSDIPGSEAYYQKDSEDSKRLAGLVYEEVLAALSAYRLRWVSVGTGVTWRTRSNGDDYYAMVQRPKPVPATLVEMAFIDNPPEAAWLAQPDTPRVEGEAVAKGILRYLTTNDPGSGYTPGGPMPPRPRPAGPRGGGGWDACDDPQL